MATGSAVGQTSESPLRLETQGALGSGGETRTPNKRINSPLLCRLSYPGRRSPKGRAARRIPEGNPNSGPGHATPLNGEIHPHEVQNRIRRRSRCRVCPRCGGGRERYDQLKTAFDKVRTNETCSAQPPPPTVRLRRSSGRRTGPRYRQRQDHRTRRIQRFEDGVVDASRQPRPRSE